MTVYGLLNDAYIRDKDDLVAHYGSIPAPSYFVETDESLDIGDSVVVTASNHLAVMIVVKLDMQNKNATYQLVQKVDLASIKAKQAADKQAVALKAELDKLVAVQAQIDKYAPYAETNPVVADKLNQLRSLMGLTAPSAKAAKST